MRAKVDLPERIFHKGIIAGKLNLFHAIIQRRDQADVKGGEPPWTDEYTYGQIAAVTPRGALRVSVSISLLTSSFSPMSRWGNEQAASTTCRPRWTSPFASENVFPCSNTIDLAKSS